MFTSWFKKYFKIWLNKRRPAKKEHTLEQNNLFIFPSLLGGCYLVFIFLLWLLGTNYDNNLILGLSYLFISVFLISIFHSFLNLQSLKVSVRDPAPFFVGENIAVQVQFKKAHKRAHQNIKIRWNTSKQPYFSIDDTKDNYVQWDDKADIVQARSVSINLSALYRGKFQLPRLAISSTYPFGLIRCWCELNLDAWALVYPAPINAEVLKELQVENNEQDVSESNLGQGQSLEFQDLQRYQPGAPLSKIAWKQYARTGTLMVKNFEGSTANSCVVSWYDYPNIELEQKLQYLCYQALSLYDQQQAFAFILPNLKLQTNHSKQHLHQVLHALALYQNDS
jgi:uncharacterized protein (DUF58 family)